MSFWPLRNALVMAAMEAADENGGDSRCNCGTSVLDFVPCDNKTAHVAYIAIAEKTDEVGGTITSPTPSGSA